MNAGRIKALRKCGKQTPNRCCDCEYYDRAPWCEAALVNDAADALEATEKRIDELEKQVAASEKLVKRCGKRMSKLEAENENLQDNLREKVIMLQRAKEGYVDAEN